MNKIIVFLLGCFAFFNIFSAQEYVSLEVQNSNEIIAITTVEGLYRLVDVLQQTSEPINYDIQPSAIAEYLFGDDKNSCGSQFVMRDLAYHRERYPDHYNNSVAALMDEIQNKEQTTPELHALSQRFLQLPISELQHVQEEMQNINDEYNKKRSVYICQMLKNVAFCSAFLIGIGAISACSWAINTYCTIR